MVRKKTEPEYPLVLGSFLTHCVCTALTLSLISENTAVNEILTLGWREWLTLPELGIQHLKCKVDSGARTSAIHAYFIEPDSSSGIVRFGIHPKQGNQAITLTCEAKIVDQRKVTDSGGHQEMRYVIETPVSIGNLTWPIEITLTNRDMMRFRMLLGRTAMKGRCIVNPGKSFLFGKPEKALR